jgi:hypothetical protein
MEATEKEKSDAKTPKEAIMRISRSLTRDREAKKRWWEMLCKSQLERIEIRRGH